MPFYFAKKNDKSYSSEQLDLEETLFQSP